MTSEASSNPAVITTEDVLSKAGSSGQFQLLLFSLVAYIVVVWAAFPGAVQIFLTAEPRWQCSPDSVICNITGTVGIGEKDYNLRCEMPRKDWMFVDEYTTFVTEWDLVCDQAIYGANILTSVFVGSGIGVIIIGILSDWNGRRQALLISGLIVTTLSLYFKFSQNFWMVVIPFFFYGVGTYGALFTSLTYILEYVGVQQRASYGNLFWISYGLGYVLFGGIAYLVRKWQTLILILGLFALPGLILCWLAPESLRWLLVEGKEKQARETLQLIAKINKKDIPEDCPLPKYSNKKASSHDIRLLFKSGLAKYTLVLWFTFFSCVLIYNGVYIIAPSIGGSIYFNWFLSGTTEILTSVVGSFIHSRFKRKPVTAGFLALTTVTCTISGLLMVYDDGSLGFLIGKITTASVLLKFFTAIALNGINLIVVELYPTVIRNTAQGACAFWGAIASLTSGYVSYLMRISPFLTFGIMGGFTLIACLLVLSVLKETSEDPIPEIFTEDENKQIESMKLIDK